MILGIRKLACAIARAHVETGEAADGEPVVVAAGASSEATGG